MKSITYLASGMLVMLVVLALAPVSTAGPNFTIFTESFEGVWPGPWIAGDQDLNDGLDYWGITDERREEGLFSLWAAQVGTNSENGLPNSVNRYQDDSMNAFLRLSLANLAGYSQVTLRFDRWVEMGTGDSLSVQVKSAGGWFTLWSVQGPFSQDWTTTTLNIPLSSESLEFRYVSAPEHIANLEGTYIDNIILLGEDGSAPLLSIAEPASGTWYAARTVDVSWSAEDLASGLLYVEVRLDLGPWSNVGLGTSHSFAGLAEGSHTVSVRAVDMVGNVAIRSVTFGVDVTAPTATILEPTEGSISTSSDVLVKWQHRDDISGLSRVEVSVDGGPWIEVGVAAAQYELMSLGDGSHGVALRVTDMAGNSEETETTFRVDTNPLSPDGPTKGLLLYAIIAGGMIALLFFLGQAGRLPFWPAGWQKKTEEKGHKAVSEKRSSQRPRPRPSKSEDVGKKPEAESDQGGQKKPP